MAIFISQTIYIFTGIQYIRCFTVNGEWMGSIIWATGGDAAMMRQHKSGTYNEGLQLEIRRAMSQERTNDCFYNYCHLKNIIHSFPFICSKWHLHILSYKDMKVAVECANIRRASESLFSVIEIQRYCIILPMWRDTFHQLNFTFEIHIHLSISLESASLMHQLCTYMLWVELYV